MKRTIIFCALATFAAFGSLACDNEAKNSSSFTTNAAQGGMVEVRLGNLALAKAQSAEVKQFAEQMVADHTKANNELKEVAAKKSVALPTEVSDEQKSMLDKLSKLSGADFDKAYVKAMVEDHEKDVKEFQTQAQTGTDADVKAFATNTLPTLKAHLEMIKGIDGRMMK
jgi:putative membrane protein